MKINKLNNKELEVWLSLARTIGPIKFFSILRTHGSLDEVLKYLNRVANNKVYGIQDAREEINNAERIGAKIIPACDPDYPDRSMINTYYDLINEFFMNIFYLFILGSLQPFTGNSFKNLYFAILHKRRRNTYFNSNV